MSMKVKLWGTRGSIATPPSPAEIRNRIAEGIEGFLAEGHRERRQIADYLDTLQPASLGGHGGNTVCVEVSTRHDRIIIDAGTGIRNLSHDLLKGPLGRGRGECHLFFTHFHWDHIVGLPFFTPLFIPGNTIHIYAVQPDLEAAMRALFQKPFFPVPFDDLGAEIHFHRLQPRAPFTLEGGMKITPYQLDHPDPCWGYKVEHAGRAYAHCVDSECTRVARHELGPDLPLYQNVDLMVFDAQYTLIEAIEKHNWGHAAAPIGLDIAMREGISRVVFVHHDPNASEAKIAAAEKHARQYHRVQMKVARKQKIAFHDVEWIYGVEGMVFEI